MAVDEAILEAHLAGLIPPTLRLYQFSPPAVSFGYAQKTDEALIKSIQAKGFDVVRRPTGGRAVLHYGDLTYAFICSTRGAPVAEHILVSESIVNAYKQICQALILSLGFLGLEVTLGNSKSNYRNKDDCFLATTIGDLQFQGNKIIGSAQLRRRHGVLQHGSIILNQPQSLMQELIGNSKPLKHHANLFEEASKNYSITALEQTLIKGFEQTFNCQFLPTELTAQEQTLADSLMPKYQHLSQEAIKST